VDSLAFFITDISPQCSELVRQSTPRGLDATSGFCDFCVISEGIRINPHLEWKAVVGLRRTYQEI